MNYTTIITLYVVSIMLVSPLTQAHRIECIFSHGIADTGAQVRKYIQYPYNRTNLNQYYTIETPVYTFDYPDATHYFWRVNFWHTSLGQSNEIQQLEKAIESRRALYAGMHTSVSYILYGVSRGASSVLNYVGSKKNSADIRALVLESPFDCIYSVADACIRRAHLSSIPGAPGLLHSAISALFRLYHKDGISPRACVSTIALDMPILIICSKEDTLVPWQSSFALYKLLRQTNHQNAHILVLTRGKHAKLFSAHYHEVVHAFYRQYGLPHNLIAALKGERRFISCQPAI